MAALLRLAAMLVSHVVHPLRMLFSLLSRECHTDVEPDRLPATEDGISEKVQPAATPSQTQDALMLRDRDVSRRSRKAKAEAIVSKHEGGLTGASHVMAHRQQSQLISPLVAKAGTQGSPRSLFQPEAAAQNQSKPPSLSWIPAPHPERAAGTSKGAGTSGAMSEKSRH
jgi:hypothetical protein